MNQFDSSRALRTRLLRRAVLTTLLTRAISVAALLLLTPLLTRELGSEKFGVLVTLTSTALVLGSADFGVANGLVSKIASISWQSTRTRDLLSAAAALVIAASGVALLVAAVATWTLPWPDWLNAPSISHRELRLSTLFALIGVALSLTTSLGQKIELAQQRGHAVAMWGAFAALSGPAAAVIVGAFSPGLPQVTAAYALAPPLVLAVQTVLVLWSLPTHLRPRLKLASRATMLELLRTGSVYFGLSMVIAVSFQIDTLIVSSILGASVAGQFSVVVRMFGLVATLIQASLTQLWSAFAEALSREDFRWVKTTLTRSSVVAGGVALVATSVLVVIGQPMVEVWLGQSFRPSMGLLIAAAVWTTYSALIHPLAMFLNGSQMQVVQLIAAVPMAILNIGLSLTLTRELGTPGPLMGSVIAHLSCIGIPLGYVVYRRMKRWENTVAT